MTKPKRKINPYLSSARAYWRLAAKAERAGQSQQARIYRSIADRRYSKYLRDRS